MKQFFLFQKGAKGLSIPRQVSFWLYHGVLYLLANVGLGIGSLWFATGEYGQTMFDSYFEFPTLIWLNVLPVVLLGLLAVVTASLVDGSFNPFLYFRF